MWAISYGSSTIAFHCQASVQNLPFFGQIIKVSHGRRTHSNTTLKGLIPLCDLIGFLPFLTSIDLFR